MAAPRAYPALQPSAVRGRIFLGGAKFTTPGTLLKTFAFSLNRGVLAKLYSAILFATQSEKESFDYITGKSLCYVFMNRVR